MIDRERVYEIINDKLGRFLDEDIGAAPLDDTADAILTALREAGWRKVPPDHKVVRFVEMPHVPFVLDDDRAATEPPEER